MKTFIQLIQQYNSDGTSDKEETLIMKIEMVPDMAIMMVMDLGMGVPMVMLVAMGMVMAMVMAIAVAMSMAAGVAMVMAMAMVTVTATVVESVPIVSRKTTDGTSGKNVQES